MQGRLGPCHCHCHSSLVAKEEGRFQLASKGFPGACRVLGVALLALSVGEVAASPQLLAPQWASVAQA